MSNTNPFICTIICPSSFNLPCVSSILCYILLMPIELQKINYCPRHIVVGRQKHSRTLWIYNCLSIAAWLRFAIALALCTSVNTTINCMCNCVHTPRNRLIALQSRIHIISFAEMACAGLVVVRKHRTTTRGRLEDSNGKIAFASCRALRGRRLSWKWSDLRDAKRICGQRFVRIAKSTTTTIGMSAYSS